MALVPLAKASISNTPMGPFQITVYANNKWMADGRWPSGSVMSGGKKDGKKVVSEMY